MLVRLGFRAQLGLQLVVAIMLAVAALGPNAALGKDRDQSQSPPKWDAELAGMPPKPEKHKRPLIRLAQGLGQEVGSNVSAIARDSIFVFSAQDIDPYERKAPPTNRPYTVATFNLVDGSVGRLVKYPDGSGRAFGGYIDGTVLIPQGDHRWLVKYPNGVQGSLRRMPDGSLQVARPDNTTTTFTRKADGSYRIANDQIGYMGDLNPESSGFSFQLK